MVIAKILQLEGIEFISVYPGGGAKGTIAPIINDCLEVGIRPILARQERVAINIADGYTRVSGRTGVAGVSVGVGVENAFSGMAQAHSDNVPMLLLAGQLWRRRLGIRAPQDLDALHAFLKITKMVGQINMVERVSEFMRRAFTCMRTGRPGPVFLEIPHDVAHAELEDAKFSYQAVRGWKTSGDPQDVEVAVRALLAAKNPLIYAGEGVMYAGAWDELREFAELVQAPVMTTLKAKGAIPEDHPLSVGHGGTDSGGKLAAHFLLKADLILAIGASLTKGYGAPIPKVKTIIQSTIDELDLNKDYTVDLSIMGDAKLVLRQLISEVRKQVGDYGRSSNETLINEIKSVKEEWIKEWMPKFTSNEVPINPYRVIWDLMHVVDRKTTIVTHDSGWPRMSLAPLWETLIPRGYIGWGHHTPMGYSLGGAMGAKLAAPEKIVINFMGDGSFGMTGMDFETAVREKIPVLTILLNNRGLGHYYKDTPKTAFVGGDYAKVAEALGGYSETVENPDEIIPAYKRAKNAIDSGRAALLEMLIKLEHEMHGSKYWDELKKLAAWS